MHPADRARVLSLAWLLMMASGGISPVAASQPEFSCVGEAATMIGTDDADLLVGTSGRDVIVGLGGDDSIVGLGGNDVLCGDGGNDIIDAGSGADLVFGGAGADTIRGRNGEDQIYGGDGNDVVYGGGKDDIISGAYGNDKIFGRSGNDTIFGGAGSDRMRGDLGDDVIDGSDGRDRCEGEVEYNCEVAAPGNPLDLLASADNMVFQGATPFHIRHGWACDPIQMDCSIAGVADVDFELLVDGLAMTHKGVELATIVDEWRQKLWVFTFPEGLSGIHVIHGRWLERGVLAHERIVVVDFS